MQVQEIMTRSCACVGPEDTLQRAAERMQTLGVGSLPICDRDRLAGMVTDRDIVVRAVAAGRDPRSTPVREVFTPDLIWCYEDEEVESAARLMRDNQIRRLPVLSREKRLVGIVSLGDLAVEAGNDNLSGATLERISEPPSQGNS